MSRPGYLVFETGGTKLVAGVAGADCRLRETRILYRENSDRAEKSFRRLIEAGQELRRKHGRQGTQFRAIGFGFGGYVRRSKRETLSCLHENGWEGLPVVPTLEQEFSLPVSLENDCKLAALAEAHFGAGCGHRTVFYMTIGTGIGGGIVRDGHILAMSDVGEAEIGHTVVAWDGPPCGCGNRGCLEAVCSGPGLSQLAAWMAREHPDAWSASSLQEHFVSPSDVSSKDLMTAWQSQDGFGEIVIDRAAGYLASAAAATINLLNPDVFVVGGGVGSGNAEFLRLWTEKTRRLVVVYFRDQVRIVPSVLREQVVTQGAAILAAQHAEELKV